MKNIFAIFISIMIIVAISGCKNVNCVASNTATGIGVKFGYNPINNLPEGQVAFLHSANLIVPTNRVSDDTDKAVYGNGATDSVDVLSEIMFTSFFAFWNSNPTIYERLAVGKNAVNTPGAIAMMSKSIDGKLSTQAVEALKALGNKNTSDNTISMKTQLIDMCKKDPIKKSKVVDMLKVRGITWDQFIDGNANISDADIKDMISKI